MDLTIAFLTYLFTLIPSVHGLLIALIVISGAATVALFIWWGVSNDMITRRHQPEEVREQGKRYQEIIPGYFKRVVIAAILSTGLLTFTPTQKDVILILSMSIGVEQTQQLIQSERVQSLGNKSLDAFEAYLDTLIENQEETE